jgi:NAD(P)-dependent dehydrogenase (short-subunit alcohol dehydrogenase family)
VQHARSIARAGGFPVLIDLFGDRAQQRAKELADEFGVLAIGLGSDITDITAARAEILARLGRIDILINNAANNPKMESNSEVNFSRFENFPLQQWHDDVNVGLTGAFLCAQVFGTHMAANGGGVILNIASDLALIGPDQRLYRQVGTPDHLQPVKPVTYSIVKSGLIGLTRYLATYWDGRNIRVNSVCPGGVENNQPGDFL